MTTPMTTPEGQAPEPPWRPSWKQLAQIPDSLLKARILRALDVKVPPEGRATVFLGEGFRLEVAPESGFYLMTDGISSTWLPDGSTVLRTLKWSAGTPTGDAVRAWLKSWGWVPKQKAGAPQAPPPMVI